MENKRDALFLVSSANRIAREIHTFSLKVFRCSHKNYIYCKIMGLGYDVIRGIQTVSDQLSGLWHSVRYLSGTAPRSEGLAYKRRTAA